MKLPLLDSPLLGEIRRQASQWSCAHKKVHLDKCALHADRQLHISLNKSPSRVSATRQVTTYQVVISRSPVSSNSCVGLTYVYKDGHSYDCYI